ncbi:amidohydrolase family protein [Parafrankia elaeagni]|uniref:amidohydrolase family protein n=1 Tax=Parafrankia elaeagni TaxID=222534 RepID=UPI00039BBDDD|nr:amidohydrolase family protein [Parafrankia elaeagni]
MLIDLHAHQMTPEMFDQHEHWGPFWDDGTLRIGDWKLGTKRYPGGPTPKTQDQLLELWKPEPRLAAFDRAGIDKVVLSMPLHMVMYHTDVDFATRWAQTVNDSFAQYCSSNPERFYFWAQIPMQDPQAAAKELERAVTQLGAQGVSIGGDNFGGRHAHDPALYPVWEKISELGVLVFVHGFNQSVTWGDRACDDPFDTTSIIGMNSDETLFYWYMTNGGVLDDFPDLKILITHAGGFVPFQLGRFNQTNKTMAPDSKNKKELIEYNPHFYYDLDIHSPIMRKAIIDEVGVDQMLYGDNFAGSDVHDGDLTDGLGLSEADQAKIRSENAIPLLKL